MKDQRTISYLLSKKLNNNDLTKISAANGTNSWSVGVTYKSSGDFDKSYDHSAD